MSQLKPDQELLFDLILTEGQIANLILAMEDGLEKQRKKEPDFYEGTGDSDAVKHYIHTLSSLFKGTINKNQDYDNNDVTFDYHENQLYLKYQIYISLLILNMYLHQIQYNSDLTNITESKNITVAQYAINFSTKLYWLIKKSTQFISFNDTSTILRNGTIAEYADFDEKITGCDSLYKDIKFTNLSTTTTKTDDKNGTTVTNWYLLPNSFHELTNETLYEDLKKIIIELAKEYCLSEVKELQKTLSASLKNISVHMLNVDLEQLFTNTLTYIQTKMLDFSSISVVEYLNSVVEEIQSAIFENQMLSELNDEEDVALGFDLFQYSTSSMGLNSTAFSIKTINEYLTHKMIMFNNIGQYIDNCLFFLIRLINGTKSQNLTECHEELSLCIEAYQKQFNIHDGEYNIISKVSSTSATNSPLSTTIADSTVVLNEINYLNNLINGIVGMEITTGYESNISTFNNECKTYKINDLIKNLTVETLKTHTSTTQYAIKGSTNNNIFDLIYNYESITSTTYNHVCGKYICGELYRNYHTAMFKLSSSVILLYFLQKFYEYIGLYSNLRQVKTRQSIQNQLYREIPNCAPGEYIRIKILQNELIRLTQLNNTEENSRNNRNIKTRDGETIVDTTDNIYKGLLNLMYSLIYYNNKIVKDLNNPEEFENLDPNCLYPHSYVSPIHIIYDDDTWKETLLKFVKTITHEYNIYFCIKDSSEIEYDNFEIDNNITKVELNNNEIKFGLLINYFNYVAQGILNTNIDSKKIDQRYVYSINDLQIFLTELIYICNAMTVHWSNLNILDENEENIIGIGKILNFTYNDLAARQPYRTVNIGITYDTSKVSLDSYVYPKGTYKMKVVRFIYNEMLRMINATNIHLKIKIVYMFVLYVINAYLLHINVFNMNPLEKNPSN